MTEQPKFSWKVQTWDRLIDHLITIFYYRFRQQLKLPFDSLDNEPVIRFGGFVLAEPWIDEKDKIRIRCGWHDRLVEIGSLNKSWVRFFHFRF